MPEVQDIFLEYGGQYRQQHKLPLHILKTMTAIEHCRTSALGGHLDVCEECGGTKISYNSCRNRHCPKCQTLAKERWIDNQKADLLNVGYFHVVFTIPDTLNTIAFQNQKVVYFLGNRNKTTKLKVCKQRTSTPIVQNEKTSAIELIERIIGHDVSKCPHCGYCKLIRYMNFGTAPPTHSKTA